MKQPCASKIHKELEAMAENMEKTSALWNCRWRPAATSQSIPNGHRNL